MPSVVVGAEAVLAASAESLPSAGLLPSDTGGSDDRLTDEGEFAHAATSLFEHSGIGLAILDLEARIRNANDAFCRHFGHDRHDLLEREFTSMLHPHCRGRLLQELATLTSEHAGVMMQRSVPLWAGDKEFIGELTGIALDGGAKLRRTREIMILISPEISRRSQASIAPHKLLTELDARILEGVAAGKSTVNLAAKLHLSRQGIDYHISAMFVRFNISNRTALVSKAYAMGLLSVNSWPPEVPAGRRHSA
jgi:PAS domain S-box-containing protein